MAPPKLAPPSCGLNKRKEDALNTTEVIRLARTLGVGLRITDKGKLRATPRKSVTLELDRGIRENLEDLRRRALFLKVVEHLDQHGGQAAVDYLTDLEPEQLDRVWLDENIPTFRQYLRRRCEEALAAVEEGRAA